MGGQQSQLPNQKQQQPDQRHQHFHHFLTRQASIRHLERSSTSFAMNKICRASSQSYPYPRTHTLVVVPPSRPVIESETEENYIKARPPLNRAIPPIPESKSNDSIMTHASEKYSETHAEPKPSTSRAVRQPSRIKPIGQSVALPNAKEPVLPSREIENDESLIIENRMAQNLATKTAVIVSSRSRRPEDVPRSPLMSVAHSVRTKLTKLGSRFSRSEGNQNIRTSTSLSSMRRGPDKTRDLLSNTHFKKSASMETRNAHSSTSMDSIKSSISSRQSSGSGAPGIPRISGSRPPLNNQKPSGETSEKNALLNQSNSSKLCRPKNLPSRPGNETKTNSIVRAFKVHLEPRPTQTTSPPDRIRNPMTPTASFTMATKMRTSKNESTKEAKILPTMNVVMKSNEGEVCSAANCTELAELENNINDQMKVMSTSRQRSFIPLYTTPPRRVPARKARIRIGQAPLAECESSCIENSPAVEMPPVKFIPDKNQDIRAERNPENGTVEPQSPTTYETSSPANSVRGAYSTQFESTQNSGETPRKDPVSDETGDDYTPTDVVVIPNSALRSNSPNVASANGTCDSDTKSGNSPNEFISPTAMTSSGFTTSSGFQDSPDKSPDKDTEFDEQFSDMTLTLKAGRSRSRRPAPRDLDQESVAATNSVSAQYKNKRYDEPAVSKTTTVAFPSMAMYESSFNDVVYIKNQLLELRSLINKSVEAESAEKSNSKKMEESDVVRRLLEENDALRKELMEKDRIISNLKAQMLLH